MPTPVAGGGSVYTAGARGNPAVLRLKPSGSGVTAEQVYAKAGLPNAIGGSVLVGEYLYGTTATGLMCIEFATGKEMWKERSIAPASLCYADGRLYVHAEEGPVALVEATPEAYREKGRFTPPDPPRHLRTGFMTDKAWAYPVVANGRLYVRDVGTLWCYDVRGTGAAP
jgi:hypothetical protein